jgi:hypothetical protein
MDHVPEVEVRAVSAVDDVLRGELLACWTDVSNAGGAVGFVPRSPRTTSLRCWTTC